MKLRKIEVLEKSQNKKGDLFGRLMSDLFHTLGYDEPRLNIHKSGREIDLTSYHRTEKKIALAECKAHSDTIGGADINKFIGAIDAEKRKVKKDSGDKYSVVGYFISLSGFKETAIEQEKEFDNGRVILIKPEKIAEELISGRILVSTEKALSSLSNIDSNLTLLDYSDLLAYDKGWVWAFYFSDSEGQKPSHYALIHAEGKPLIKDLASEIIEIDSKVKNIFKDLSLINKYDPVNNSYSNSEETKRKYYKYLENELGDIQFEGLPTDKEAGAVKVKLENIFVPLHLIKNEQRQQKDKFDVEERTRESIGNILSRNSKIAILAKPGGGKSTLIKRIAIAYAFPERREQINDSLPNKSWFPIFLRCRELGNKVTFSITDIINSIPSRAEIPSCSEDFSILVSRALQNGNALLLIDGLDEIAEDRNRITFVNQLRTFIATYPSINIIVTSREAGFRAVAGSLATYCENFSMSNLVDTDVRELCLKWHKAIIDDSENTVKEANKLSELILNDSRIKVLAENPLLLTTLLFVKRWAGYLPTKKSILYQEMIKLLLVTWNVEGHEILDIEEAEPQLAFVAYWMTNQGQQTITADELNRCLIDARKQMPEILGYTNINPSEFIKRVESRSSLLIMTGHKRLESGNITAVYEFLHLSFQEYLAAKAIVKKFLPQSETQHRVVDILKPNVENENWKEVIPLAAVLLERDTKDLIEYLISECKSYCSKEKKDRSKDGTLTPTLLGRCLANEIQITPSLLEIAIEWFAKNAYTNQDKENTEIILKNKFGIKFRERVKECFFEKYDDHNSSAIGSTLADIFLIDVKSNDHKRNVTEEILLTIKDEQRENQCIAILGMMAFSFQISTSSSSINNADIKNSEEIFEIMLRLLDVKDPHLYFSIFWCLAWASQTELFPQNLRDDFVEHLSKAWVQSKEQNIQRVASWSLSKLLLPSIPKNKILTINNIENTIQAKFQSPSNEFDKLTSIYLGVIIGTEFDKKEVTEVFRNNNGGIKLTKSNALPLFATILKINLKESKNEINVIL
ncbi:NACHT domain-containing protein [Sphingobacterium sp.]|uniref:NACHT domain-containing protein n=1 Tax=Sphingobacterium sp. TaxID=341027 RepID=UPI0028AE9FC6|nr:NACHT domain-containing protein [Sphingobacterium sp.]